MRTLYFTAPISPKVVLLNSAWMNYVMSVVLWAVLAIGGADCIPGGAVGKCFC